MTGRGQTPATAASEALAEAGAWLARQGFAVDYTTDEMPPPALWEAFVDAVHRNEGGNWHSGDLSRDYIDAWLRDEAGYPSQRAEDQP